MWSSNQSPGPLFPHYQHIRVFYPCFLRRGTISFTLAFVHSSSSFRTHCLTHPPSAVSEGRDDAADAHHTTEDVCGGPIVELRPAVHSGGRETALSCDAKCIRIAAHHTPSIELFSPQVVSSLPPPSLRRGRASWRSRRRLLRYLFRAYTEHSVCPINPSPRHEHLKVRGQSDREGLVFEGPNNKQAEGSPCPPAHQVR